MRVQEPQEARSTKWRNPLDVPQTVVLDGMRYKIGPGETREIDSKYDRAIQTIDPKSNVTLGGLAPQLQNLSKAEADRPRLHEALDASGTAIKEAAAQLALAKQARQDVEAAEMIAAKRLVDAASDSPKPPTSGQSRK